MPPLSCGGLRRSVDGDGVARGRPDAVRRRSGACGGAACGGRGVRGGGGRGDRLRDRGRAGLLADGRGAAGRGCRGRTGAGVRGRAPSRPGSAARGGAARTGEYGKPSPFSSSTVGPRPSRPSASSAARTSAVVQSRGLSTLVYRLARAMPSSSERGSRRATWSPSPRSPSAGAQPRDVADEDGEPGDPAGLEAGPAQLHRGVHAGPHEPVQRRGPAAGELQHLAGPRLRA